MKLLKNQYQDILNALDDLNIGHERLSLIKKKGRIKIHIEGIDSYFEFFRRKSVSLTAKAHQWQKSEHYELNSGDKAAQVAEWPEVLTHFQRWVETNSSLIS